MPRPGGRPPRQVGHRPLVVAELGNDPVGFLEPGTLLELKPEPGEFLFRDRHAAPRLYRVSRQVIDVPPTAFDAVFLMPLPGATRMPDEAPAAPVACLPPGVTLTRRESQVLDGIMCGKLNKTIAGELHISPKTVELHRANLMAKLRVHNAVELARAVLDMAPRAEEAATL